MTAQPGPGPVPYNPRATEPLNVQQFGVVHDPSGLYIAANTIAYQAALNNAAGHTVLHPPGLIVVHTGLFISQALELQINGTLFLAATIAGQTSAACIVINASFVTVRIGAAGVIDGNKANQNFTVYGLYGEAGITTAQNPARIDNPLPTQGAQRFTDIYLYGPGTIQNTYVWQVGLNNVRRCKVIGLKFLNGGAAPGVADDTTDFEFAFNYTENNPDYGFAAYQGCSYGSFHHNICVNVASVGVDNDGGVSTGYNLWPCHNIQIHDNLIVNSTNAACSIASSSVGGTSAWHYDIEVFDNQFINCGTAVTNPIITASGVRALSVKRNLISGGGNVTFVNNSGIGGNSTQTPNMVIENNVIENLLPGTSSSFGVLVGAAGLICRNNIIRDTRATPLMGYGTFGTCGASTIITGNVISGMVGAANGATPIADTIFVDGGNDNYAKPPAIGGTTPAAGTFTALAATGGVTFAGGTNGVGSIYTDANWGGLFRGRSGAQADLAFQSSTSNTGLKLAASGLVTLPLGVAISGTSTIDAATLGATTPAAASVTQLNLTTSAGPNVRSGTGAATGTQPKGSIWMRTDGAVGSTMYVSQGAGTWNAVAGV